MVPEAPGTYVLILNLSRSVTVLVGRLGTFGFPSGWYAYAGSARGPGGLAARISHHRRASKTHHWHIDYLRSHADLAAVWFTTGPAKRECRWAEALSSLPGASVVAPRFGASDCRCATHLLHFSSYPDLSAFSRLIGDAVSESSLGT